MRCSSYQRFCRAVHAGEIVSHVQVTLEPGSSLSNWRDIGTDGQRSLVESIEHMAAPLREKHEPRFD